MTDLKVWVDGKERVIRGVSEGTTCESVVLVLAKAAGKSGKVALLEKWRDFERILPRNENPLKCLETWGIYKPEVCLFLRDDEAPKNTGKDLNKGSINSGVDDKYDLIKRSFDLESLESFTALEENKLAQLARAVEIVDLQLGCLDDNDEAALYLTEEEIIEDYSLKLSSILKLQGKELVEFETYETELEKHKTSQDKMLLKHEDFTDKISHLESGISDSYELMREILDQIEDVKDESFISESSFLNSDIQSEVNTIHKKLEEEKLMFRNQTQELETVNASVLNAMTFFQRKSQEVKRLRKQVESDNFFHDLDQHFRPMSLEEESRFLKSHPDKDADIEMSRKSSDFSNSSLKNREFNGAMSSQVEDDIDFDFQNQTSEKSFPNISDYSTDLSNLLLNGHLPLLNRNKHLNLHTRSFPTEKDMRNTTFSGKIHPRSSPPLLQNQPKVLLKNSTIKPVSTSVTSQKSSTLYNNDDGSIGDVSSKTYPRISSSDNVTETTENTQEYVRDFLSRLQTNKWNKEKPSFRPEVKPKPQRKNTPIPIQTATLWNNKVKKESHKSIKEQTLPKHQQNSISKPQTSVKIAESSLISSSAPHKSYLLPPTALHKRTHQQRGKAINNSELCEEGVFV